MATKKKRLVVEILEPRYALNGMGAVDVCDPGIPTADDSGMAEVECCMEIGTADGEGEVLEDMTTVLTASDVDASIEEIPDASIDCTDVKTDDATPDSSDEIPIRMYSMLATDSSDSAEDFSDDAAEELLSEFEEVDTENHPEYAFRGLHAFTSDSSDGAEDFSDDAAEELLSEFEEVDTENHPEYAFRGLHADDGSDLPSENTEGDLMFYSLGGDLGDASTDVVPVDDGAIDDGTPEIADNEILMFSSQAEGGNVEDTPPASSPDSVEQAAPSPVGMSDANFVWYAGPSGESTVAPAKFRRRS